MKMKEVQHFPKILPELSSGRVAQRAAQACCPSDLQTQRMQMAGGSYAQKNVKTSGPSLKQGTSSSSRTLMQLFIKDLVTNKTHIAVLAPSATAAITLNGREFGPIDWNSVQSHDTLTLRGRQLIGGTSTPLLDETNSRVDDCSDESVDQAEEGQVFRDKARTVVNMELLGRSEGYQIDQLLETLPEEERKLVENEQLKLLPFPFKEEGEQTAEFTFENLQEIDEYAKQSWFVQGVDPRPGLADSLWQYRQGTNGSQLVSMESFLEPAKCCTLRADDSWSDVFNRTHMLKIYNLSADGGKTTYDLESTTNLSLTGDIIGNMRAIRPHQKDLAFICKNKNSENFSLNIIHDKQATVEATELSTIITSELHDLLIKTDPNGHDYQVFRDKETFLMLAISNFDGDQNSVLIYCVASMRTIVRVQGVSHLLYMGLVSADRMCIFNQETYTINYADAREDDPGIEASEVDHICIFDHYSCNIDFAEARERASDDALEIDLKEEVELEQGKFKAQMQTLFVAETDYRDWSRDGQVGFAAWNQDERRTQIVQVRSPTEFEPIEVQEEAAETKLAWQVKLQSWITGESLSQVERRDQGVGDNFEVMHHLGVMTKASEPRTIILNDLRTKQNVCVEFWDPILTIATPLSLNDDRPFFIVFTENSEQEQVSMTKIYFEWRSYSDTESQISNYQAITELVTNEQWQKDLLRVAKTNHSCKFKKTDLYGGLMFILQTDTQLIQMENEVRQLLFEETATRKLRPIGVLYNMVPIVVVADKVAGNDLITIRGQTAEPIYEIKNAQVIHCVFVNDILYILDSDYTLRTLGFGCSHDGRLPTVLWTKLSQLPNIDELTEILQRKSPYIGMTDTNIAFDGKVISFETGKILLQEDSSTSSMVLLPNMLVYNTRKNQITLRSNPGSRKLNTSFAVLPNMLRKFHQISPRLLLMQQGQKKKEQEEREWLLMGTDGTPIDLPIDLRQVLRSQCEEVHSYLSSSGNCQLLVIYRSEREDDQSIVSAELVELTKEDGAVAFKKDLQLNIIDNVVAKEFILKNYQGDFLQVRMTKIVDLASEPELTETDGKVNHIKPRLTKTDGKLSLITFDSANETTRIAYAGEYFCWLDRIGLCALNIRTGEFKTIELFKTLHQLVSLDACEPISLVIAGWLEKVDKPGMLKLADHVQVYDGGQVRIFNLRPREPVNVSARNSKDNIFPDAYIEAGFKLIAIEENVKTIKQSGGHQNTQNIKTGGISRKSLSPSLFRNLLIEEHDNRDVQVYRLFTSEDVGRTTGYEESSPHDFLIAVFWAQFRSQSFLSMMQEQPFHFAHFRQALEEARQDNPHHFGTHIEGRINDLLQRRTVNIDKNIDDNVELKAISLITDLVRNTGTRDQLLKIGEMSSTFSLVKMFDSQESLNIFAKNASPQMIDSLSSSFFQTDQMMRIRNLNVPSDFTQFIYMSASIEVRQEELENYINNELIPQEKWHETLFIQKKVKAEMLCLDWLFADGKNFIALSTILSKMPVKFYSSKFVMKLLDHFWDEAQSMMIWHKLLPYIALVVLAIIYFHHSLSQEAEELRAADAGWLTSRIIEKVIGISALPFLALSIRVEFKQMMSQEQKLDYFKEFFNWIDISGMLLTLAILFLTLLEIEWLSFGSLRLMASLATWSLLIKAYDWMRLFDSTSFFILLIENTLGDIKAFMVLLSIALLTFGLPLSMLDMDRSEEGQLIQPVFGFWILDAFYNQYLLSLGEFASLDNVENGTQEKLVLAFFSMATFFTMVTMLNMLIAIMGDSFSEATENREKYAVKTKLDILSSQAPSLPQTENRGEDEGKVFMIIVSEVQDEGFAEEDSWQGSIQKVAHLTNKAVRGLESDMKKSMMENEKRILKAVDTKTGRLEAQGLEIKQMLVKLLADQRAE